MITLPHTPNDLRLAPLALAISSRIEELSHLSVDQLANEVAITADSPDWTRELRQSGLLRTVLAGIDSRGWDLAWDGKDLRLSRHAYSVVLGVPPQFLDYVDGRARASSG